MSSLNAHQDRAPLRTSLLAAAVVLVFCGVNAWVAVDHLGIPNRLRSQSVDTLKGIRALAEQRSALLGARADNGAIDLQMMQKAGVRVPDSFIKNGAFTSPFGSSQIIKQDDLLIWDFYEIMAADCAQLLEDSSTIPGVIRVAPSASAIDEKTPPLTHDVAARACSRTGLMTRLILNQKK
jgi:hypothetical protein